MDNATLILGELRAHGKATNDRLNRLEDSVNDRFDKVDTKVNHLNNWKLKVVGGSLVLSAIGSAIITWIIKH